MPRSSRAARRRLPWVQVWSADGARAAVSERRSAAPAGPGGASALAAARPTIASSPSRRPTCRCASSAAAATLGGVPVVIQVGALRGADAAGAARAAADPRRSACRWRWPWPASAATRWRAARWRPIERMTERARIDHRRAPGRSAAGATIPTTRWDGWRRCSTRRWRGSRRRSSRCGGSRPTCRTSCARRSPRSAASARSACAASATKPAYRGIIGSMLEEADRLAEPRRSAADAVARRDAARRSCRARSFDLQALADDVSAHLGVLAEEKGQSIEVVTSAAPRRRARRSAGAAAGADQPRGQRDQVHAGRRPHPHPRLGDAAGRRVVDVIDTGPGIPPEATRAHLRPLLPRRRRDRRGAAPGSACRSRRGRSRPTAAG